MQLSVWKHYIQFTLHYIILEHINKYSFFKSMLVSFHKGSEA